MTSSPPRTLIPCGTATTRVKCGIWEHASDCLKSRGFDPKEILPEWVH
jgi:hypothetical protein